MKQATKAKETNVVAISSKKKARTGKLSALEQACAEVVAKADKLHEQHTQFHTQYVERSNDALYALLADMQQVCMDVIALPNCDKVIKKLRTYMKMDFDIKTSKKTTAVGVIVRYTLRGHRKTMHVYTRVLQTAIDAGVQPSALADYIRERGGIDKIRSEVVSADARAAHRLGNVLIRDAFDKAMWEQHKENPLGLVKWHENGGRIAYGSDSDCGVLLAMCQPGMQGTTIVGSIFVTNTMMDAMIAQHLTYLKAAATSKANGEREEVLRQYKMSASVLEDWQRSNNLRDEEAAKRQYERFHTLLGERLEKEKQRDAERDDCYKRSWLSKLTIKERKSA